MHCAQTAMWRPHMKAARSPRLARARLMRLLTGPLWSARMTPRSLQVARSAARTVARMLSRTLEVARMAMVPGLPENLRLEDHRWFWPGSGALAVHRRH